MSNSNSNVSTSCIFNKDCLIRLGTCIAPLGKGELGSTILEYSFKIDGKDVKGELKYGELILIKADFSPYKAQFTMEGDFTLGSKKEYIGDIYGGEVGIILDGRGRPFNFEFDTKNRRRLINDWSSSMNEYPNLEI